MVILLGKRILAFSFNRPVYMALKLIESVEISHAPESLLHSVIDNIYNIATQQHS